MNADVLLAYYERISEAPDAIARLRRFVLDLAVRGKLVPQDTSEEPASELLERIAREKARSAKAGEISPPSSPGGSDLDRLVLEIPPHWVDTTIREVLHELQTGPFGSSLHQTDYQEGGTPVINPASIQENRIIPIAKMAVGPETLEKLASFRLRAGDIVMGRRGEMGRCALITDREAGWLCGTGSLILRPSLLIFGPFLVLLIGSPYGREYLGGSAVGTTMQNLNQAILLKMRFGLPPAAEQRRIVAKVDELMALCDRLDAARAAREATRDRLAAASLARVNAPDPETFPADACFALDVLHALTARPDQIKQIRQTILRLAVRGKLVQQNPEEEPASKLLARIAEEFRRLVAQGRLNRPKAVSPVAIADVLFPPPEGWAFARFAEIAAIQSNLVNPKHHLEMPHIAPDNIESWTARLLPYGTIREAGVFSSKHLFSAGAILYSKIRPNLAKVTKVDFAGLCSADMYPLHPMVDQDFLLYFMITPDFVSQAVSEENRVAMPKINQSALSEIIVPVPPLAEQHRIVAKVNGLMAVCNQLEASLTATNTARVRLLEATLREALQPAEAPVLEAEAAE